MPIDFLGIGSKPEYYLSLTFFRRVMWLKQNWVAETGFIQGPDQRALSAPSGRPPGVYVLKPSEQMVLGQMREELLKRLAWHLPYGCRVDCAWSSGREQQCVPDRKNAHCRISERDILICALRLV